MWLLSVFLKPFIATIFLTLVLLLAVLIYRRLPDSKFKQLLFAPLPGHKPRDWSALAGGRKR